METTGRSLVEYWDTVGDKGIMKPKTAEVLQSACRQVLSVEDGWEDLDIMQIDAESMFKRFVNKRAKGFKPGSLAAYRRRFFQALTMFKNYVNDPVGWKPTTRERNSAPKGNGNGDDEPEQRPAAAPKMSSTTSAEAGLVDYPYPLREGRIARLRLPADLKMIEVRRLTAFMSTLAVDFEAPEG